MGFRYRKSINLGGGFRINLSKSGVGYSWGTKGFRITKTAKGTVRKTVSIPGTGISHVEEYGAGPRRTPGQPLEQNNYYGTEEFKNASAEQMVSEGLEEIMEAARKSIRFNRIAMIGIVTSAILSCAYPAFFFLILLFLALALYVRKTGRISLEYDIDPDQQAMVDQRLKPFQQACESTMAWRVTQSSLVRDKKYAAGATSSIRRVRCKPSFTPPFPFQASIPVATLRGGKETLIFFPDKLFVLQGSKVGALNYEDISVDAGATRFVEDQSVPKDAQVVGQTWRYVNKSGGLDKRFKNNRQLPVCLYGELALHSDQGLNTVIMYSKYEK